MKYIGSSKWINVYSFIIRRLIKLLLKFRWRLLISTYSIYHNQDENFMWKHINRPYQWIQKRRYMETKKKQNYITLIMIGIISIIFKKNSLKKLRSSIDYDVYPLYT